MYIPTWRNAADCSSISASCWTLNGSLQQSTHYQLFINAIKQASHHSTNTHINQLMFLLRSPAEYILWINEHHKIWENLIHFVFFINMDICTVLILISNVSSKVCTFTSPLITGWVTWVTLRQPRLPIQWKICCQIKPWSIIFSFHSARLHYPINFSYHLSHYCWQLSSIFALHTCAVQ